MSNETETNNDMDQEGERFDKFGLFDGYAARILPGILARIDHKKAADDDAAIEDACARACQIARIMLDIRDEYWVGIYPTAPSLPS